jgi:hypothetical protein
VNAAQTKPFDCFISELHREACRVNCERPTGGETSPVLELAIDAGSVPDATMSKAMEGNQLHVCAAWDDTPWKEKGQGL